MAENKGEDDLKFKLRSYQEEMLEVSMRENVIVKMDTGSGKTAIAISRAEAALNASEPEKLIWLLAPTVPLCVQHSETFQEHLPGYQVRLLIGSDGIDRWSNQATWDAVLKNIRIVISVAAVLQDALNNAFVRMERIALLIFDEAHRCVKNNPGAVLMRNWYFRAVQRPSILGLSASIIEPEDLELSLNARIVTPSRCRSELLHYVNQPVLQYLRYGRNEFPYTQKLAILEHIHDNYDTWKDPYFSKLMPEEQEEFLTKGKRSSCLAELRVLLQRAIHVSEQLGPRMADWYLDSSVRAILTRVEKAGPGNLDSAMTDDEAQHLSNLLRPLSATARKRKYDDELEDNDRFAAQYLSPKLSSLVKFLETEWTESFTGLIFVQQRVLAHALAYFLSQFSFQRAKVRVQGFVGLSKVQDPAKRLVERILPSDQRGVLQKFRSPQREINLLVATEVLQEGVDVPQCHLVVCFDIPPQIISYIQRRGRARLKDSKYILMLEKDADTIKIQKWQKLEADLNTAFQAAERAWAVSRMLEARDDPITTERQFRVPSTGALLDLHNAIPKLHHVCQSLQSGALVDLRPQFACKKHFDDTVTATVALPIVFEPSVRIAKGSQHWLTEKMARRDAAFTAIQQLYEKGLLDEHLLPLKEEKEKEADPQITEAPTKMSFCEVLPRIKPWLEAAREIRSLVTKWYGLDVKIEEIDGVREPIELTIWSPIPLSALSKFTLYWDFKTRFSVLGTPLEPRILLSSDVEQLRIVTEAILRSASGARMPAHTNDFPFGITLAGREMEYWNASRQRDPLNLHQENLRRNGCSSKPGVVWHDEQKYFFGQLTRAQFKDDDPEQEVIEATMYPKRRNFMHPFIGSSDSYTKKHFLLASECSLDSFSADGALASLFLPSILRRIALTLVAQRFQTTLLAPVRIRSLPLLQAALTARVAREAENYERLEFLGDTYIGYLTSVHLMAEKPLWPEGYLTNEKGRRVSNNAFCKAALNVGLDQFIIMDSFTGLKWVPPYVHKLLAEAETPVKRFESSRKRVADVIEATIGVAYLDGGHEAAVKLCETYFPERTWTTPDQQAAQLFAGASDDSAHLETLEVLIGYKFRKPSLLLEAMTSSAYKGGNHNARSYQRLEFLGDAILDYLTVRRIYSFSGKELPHNAMHSIKTATVNSWILGFFCMEHFIFETRENIIMKISSDGAAAPEVEEEMVKKHIWQFIRPGHRTDKEQKSLEKFQEMREDINAAFESDKKYPWSLLSRFDPAKIFSDIIESILGAIYVDSHANHEICDQFLKGIGLFKVLDRMMQDNVACMHPKELLGLVAGQRKVKYVYGEEDKMITCHVLINGEQVGGTVKGETTEIASCLAAATAVEIEQVGLAYDVVEKVWKAVSEDQPSAAELGNGDGDDVADMDEAEDGDPQLVDNLGSIEKTGNVILDKRTDYTVTGANDDERFTDN